MYAPHTCVRRPYSAPPLKLSMPRPSNGQRATVRLVSILISLALSCVYAGGQSRPIPSSARTGAQKRTSPRSDPKCSFLRSEYRRLDDEAQASADASQFGKGAKISDLGSLGATVDQLAESVAVSEEFAAKLSVLQMEIRSCDKGEALSSLTRLPFIDVTRQKHLLGAKTRWARLGGSDEDPQFAVISARINAVYDSEAKSFYNSDSVHANLDPDVVKDYPELLSLIEGSGLPPEQKRFLTEHSQFINYEEAGRLSNILRAIELDGSLMYAYTLRASLAERAKQAERTAQDLAAEQSREAARRMEGVMTWVWLASSVVLALCGALIVFANTKRYAKYKAIRDGKLLVPYWFGTKKLVLWEPGDAVVLLRDKKLVAMGDPTGGYASISPWDGEEYKGRITYKSQLKTYVSDSIHTSDGVPVKFELGIGWHIQNPNTYISRLAADYHQDEAHEGEPRGHSETMNPRSENYYDGKLKETAEKWIELLAGSTLREHICQLTVAKLISPYVQSYVDHYFQHSSDSTVKYERGTTTTLSEALAALNVKTREYGIGVQNLEIKNLHLPPNLEQKLQAVRLSFLEPPKSMAETEAKAIEQRGLTQTQVEALRGLADVIGRDSAAKIEFIKAIGLAKIPFVAPYAPPFSVMQSILAETKPKLAEPGTDFPRQPIGPAERVVEGAQQSTDQTDDSGDSKTKAE